jgi:prevent-host-death family protein
MNAKVSITQARDTLADLVGRVQYGGEHIILERRGKPVGALVSIEALELLDRLEDAELNRIGDEAHAEYLKDPTKVIGHEELWESIFADLEKE